MPRKGEITVYTECYRRKVGCDRGQPYSRCVQGARQCRYLAAPAGLPSQATNQSSNDGQNVRSDTPEQDGIRGGSNVQSPDSSHPDPSPPSTPQMSANGNGVGDDVGSDGFDPAAANVNAIPADLQRPSTLSTRLRAVEIALGWGLVNTNLSDADSRIEAIESYLTRDLGGVLGFGDGELRLRHIESHVFGQHLFDIGFLPLFMSNSVPHGSQTQVQRTERRLKRRRS